MCGIAGFLDLGRGKGIDPHVLDAMGARLSHRGPDDQGHWLDSEAGIGLSHRRLSIIDLSPAGHQPMHSVSGRWVIVFNGEIYNHLHLRRGLAEQAAVAWRGTSDTETLLAGFDAWGIEATLRKSKGMFAFAVWDRQRRELTLARDRIGQKPLYYGWQGSTFLFGSELKALTAHPAFQGTIDREALALVMEYSCIPAPHSIYSNVSKLIPGTLLRVSATMRMAEIEPYWKAVDVIASGLETPWSGSDDECTGHLDTLLSDAVRQQMVADVPLGAFLSGGVDSSTIVALMQAQTNRPVRTFTIGFSEANYDEARHARVVANHLGTDHTELYVSPEETLGLIDRMPEIYCEPFADSSQVPTFLVSQMTRRHVTVALSGDGGDEMFGGYNRYMFADRLWGRISRLPTGLRRALGRAATAISPGSYAKALDPLQRMFPSGLAQTNLGDKIHKSGHALAARTTGELYHLLLSQWTTADQIVVGATAPFAAALKWVPDTETVAQQMMALDLLFYLPEDVLCKVDRAAMAVGLETRVPMLDEDVMAFAWRLPLRNKVRAGVSKWALRQVLYKYVPRDLIERPKSGFAMPIDVWLRGPLRDWAETLIEPSRLNREGFLNPSPIRIKWQEHLSGRRNWQQHLWNVLMFQCWLERNT